MTDKKDMVTYCSLLSVALQISQEQQNIVPDQKNAVIMSL